MAGHHDNWERVSQHDPCPVCGKPDNCTVSRDGGAVWCGRVAEGAVQTNAGGQYLHILRDRTVWDTCYRPPPKPKPKKRKPVDPTRWPALADNFHAAGRVPRDWLARQLGVSAEALDNLHVGWDSYHNCWTFPERNAAGTIIGLATRYRNGQKKRQAGSKAGLIYTSDWDAGDGPILLVEGGSDTAALLTLGLNVVGRPSNRGGVDHLVELLWDLAPHRRVIVIGERDEKPDGLWPGKEGAIATATKLAEELEREIHWSLPPDEAKDSRVWFGTAPDVERPRQASLFLTGLNPQVIQPPVILSVDYPTAPAIDVPDWRIEMKNVRLSSLGRYGYYLDQSCTGAGKSSVDYAVICYAHDLEAS